jgi:hypothetical protein
MTTLTNEDKISLINQHKKNVEFAKYNIELSIIEENAVSEPNAEILSGLNAQVDDFDSKIAALDAELATLE